MSDLTDYLNDHLGGSVTGAGLARHLAKEFEGQPLGDLAMRLAGEIEEDRETLKVTIESLGGSPSNLKQAGGWLGDRAAVLLKARGDDAHSRLSLLEALTLGIEGKSLLWQALIEIAPPELDSVKLRALVERAERQRGELEPHRLAAAAELAKA